MYHSRRGFVKWMGGKCYIYHVGNRAALQNVQFRKRISYNMTITGGCPAIKKPPSRLRKTGAP